MSLGQVVGMGIADASNWWMCEVCRKATDEISIVRHNTGPIMYLDTKCAGRYERTYDHWFEERMETGGYPGGFLLTIIVDCEYAELRATYDSRCKSAVTTCKL